jgi:hypothetical protein
MSHEPDEIDDRLARFNAERRLEGRTFDVERVVYSGTCLCGHLAEDHHGAVIGDQRLVDALGLGVVPVGGCEFYDCNEGEGCDDAGEIHCVRYVDRDDPAPARQASWSEGNEKARARWHPGGTR